MAHPYAVETLEPQTPTSPGYPLTQNSPRRSPRNTSELDAGRLLPSPASSKRFRTLHRASSTPFLDKEGAVSPTTLHQASAMERGASEGPRNVAPTSFSASVRAKFGLKLGGHSASGPSDGESGSVECSPYSTAPSLSHSRGGSPTESNDSLALTPVPSPSPSPAPVHSPGYNDVPVLEIPDAEQASRRKGLFRLRNAASSASLGRSFKAHKSPRGEIPPLPGSMNAAEDSFLPDLPKASSRGSKAAAKARKSAAAGATDHSRNANDQGGVSEEPPSEVTGGTRSRGMFRGMWSTFKPTKQILTSDSNDGHVSPFKSSFQVDFRGGFDVDVRPAEPERRVSEPLAPTIASSESTSDAASEHIDAAERMAVMMEKSNTLPLGAPTTEPSTSVLGSNSLGLDIRTARGNTKGGGSSPAPSSPAAASSSITLPTLAHPFAFVSPTDASTPSGHAATPQAASESVMASPAQPSTPRRTVLKSPASSAAKLSTPAPALRTPTQTSRTPPPTQARVGDARDIQSALRSLPPLLSLYDDVKAAMCSSQDGAGYNKAGKRSLNIWQRLDAMEGRRGVKILSVTSSKDAVPKSWVGYMRAYSRVSVDALCASSVF